MSKRFTTLASVMIIACLAVATGWLFITNGSLADEEPAGKKQTDEKQADKESAPPEVGDTVEDFELRSLKDEPVQLSKLVSEGPVVVIALRGFPGYQCPLCNRQVGQFLSKAGEFEAAKARIVLIYPGSADALGEHAQEFLKDMSLPDNVLFVTDPDYTFTNAWSLRWDAQNETAYPSTFVVDDKLVVRFAKISKSHGDRSKPEDVLKALTERAER